MLETLKETCSHWARTHNSRSSQLSYGKERKIARSRGWRKSYGIVGLCEEKQPFVNVMGVCKVRQLSLIHI